MSRTFKTFAIVAMMLTGSVFTVPAQASDAGFGVRFTNREPAALQDKTAVTTPAVDVAVEQDISADGLNEIAPAAGGEMVIPPSYDTVIEDETSVQQTTDDSINEEALE